MDGLLTFNKLLKSEVEVERLLDLVLDLVDCLNRNPGIVALMGWGVTLIGWIIIAFGWYKSHHLSINAQEKVLHNQILNTSRIEITNSLHDYQLALVRLDGLFTKFEMDMQKEQLSITNWLERLDEYHKVQAQCNDAVQPWNWALENYQILFPETAKIRIYLQNRDSWLFARLNIFQLEFWNYTTMMSKEDAKRHRLEVLSAFRSVRSFITDQMCLTEDLRIHLQNICLSKITSNSVPERQPPDNSVPRITWDCNKPIVINDDIEYWQDTWRIEWIKLTTRAAIECGKTMP